MSEALVPKGPLLVVSPHLDDAALSCSALLERPEPITVLDVFTLVPEPDRSTEWDRRCGFAGAKEAMAAREEEESAAFSDTQHEVLAVDLLEDLYRDEERGLREERRFAEALLGWVGRHDRCTVALPAGAGLTPGTQPAFSTRLWALFRGQRISHANADHLWVRDTALKLLRDQATVTVWLYEELPYRWSRPADAMVGLVEEWVGKNTAALVIPIDRTRKAERLKAYRSQIPMLFRRTEGSRLAKRLPAEERYWVFEPADPS